MSCKNPAQIFVFHKSTCSVKSRGLLHDVPHAQVAIEARTLLQDVISLALRRGQNVLTDYQGKRVFFFSSRLFLRRWPGLRCFTPWQHTPAGHQAQNTPSTARADKTCPRHRNHRKHTIHHNTPMYKQQFHDRTLGAPQAASTVEPTY